VKGRFDRASRRAAFSPLTMGFGLASKTATGKAAGASGTPPGTGAAVRRRKVLYIHGFDPRGPGPYHALFSEEAGRDAAVGGRVLDVGPRRRGDDGASSWSVRSGAVEASYDFLRWDDRVRARWSKNEVALLGELAAWVGKWGRLGFFGVARRNARALWMAMLSTPVVTALYMLSAIVVVSILGFAAGALAHTLGLPFWTGAVPALLSLFLAPAVWRLVEEKLNVCWLSRCFTYMRRRAEEPSQDLAERDKAFAAAITAACADPANDEVLVVGHSLGALHAVSALSRALASDPSLGNGRLSLLTLGQPIAIFTVLPQVEGFRRELADVAAAVQVPWLDVTSPSDPASACHIDPLRDIPGVPRGRLVQRSPRFHVILTPEHFKAIRSDPIAFHFQYLRAPDVAGGFDYFDLVAGPMRLMDHPWVKQAAAKEGAS
jgi:hypothetical protein